MVQARYFDGRSAAPRAVGLRFADGLLHIEGDGLARAEPPGGLAFAISRGAAPTRITLPDGASCELADSAESRQLLELLGARPSWAERIAAHRGAVAYATGSFVALLFVAWHWGIPYATERLVARIPTSWDARLGAKMVEQIDDLPGVTASALPAERQDAIRARFEALRKDPGAPSYTIMFRKFGVPNAFAIPGGTIVVTDELVELAGGDDVALVTVLGHELGHLAYRHGMHALVRTGLFSALAAWYFGDVSTFVAGAGALLTTLHYSREAEHAADLYALRLLRANGLPTQPAAELFRKLAGWKRPGADDKAGVKASAVQLPEYLNTHPDIEDRINLFERGSP